MLFLGCGPSTIRICPPLIVTKEEADVAGGDVGGAVNDQSYFSLDGGNNTNDMDGSGGVYTNKQQGLVIGDPTGGVGAQTAFVYGAPSGVMPTPADSVEEFKVNSAGQTAVNNLGISSSKPVAIRVLTSSSNVQHHRIDEGGVED